MLDVGLGVGVQVARDDVVAGNDQCLTPGLGKLEEPTRIRLDRGDARQAAAKPEVRCEVWSEPRTYGLTISYSY